MSGGGASRFPSSMRVKRRKDFDRIYREGSTWKGRCFSLHVLACVDGKRMGIVISRKWGNAVKRNRMKRLLREAFRLNAHRLPNAAIIVRPTTACRDETVESLARRLVAAVNETVGREVSE